MEKKRKLSTRIKYRRIQAAYQQLQKARLGHEFCIEITADFFALTDYGFVATVLNKDVVIEDQEQDYLHYDLDAIWIAHRIQKHIEEHLPDDQQKQLNLNFK